MEHLNELYSKSDSFFYSGWMTLILIIVSMVVVVSFIFLLAFITAKCFGGDGTRGFIAGLIIGSFATVYIWGCVFLREDTAGINYRNVGNPIVYETLNLMSDTLDGAEIKNISIGEMCTKVSIDSHVYPVTITYMKNGEPGQMNVRLYDGFMSFSESNADKYECSFKIGSRDDIESMDKHSDTIGKGYINQVIFSYPRDMYNSNVILSD